MKVMHPLKHFDVESILLPRPHRDYATPKFCVQLANYCSVMNGAHHASIVPHQSGFALILMSGASRRVYRLLRLSLHQL